MPDSEVLVPLVLTTDPAPDTPAPDAAEPALNAESLTMPPSLVLIRQLPSGEGLYADSLAQGTVMLTPEQVAVRLKLYLDELRYPHGAPGVFYHQRDRPPPRPGLYHCRRAGTSRVPQIRYWAGEFFTGSIIEDATLRDEPDRRERGLQPHFEIITLAKAGRSIYHPDFEWSPLPADLAVIALEVQAHPSFVRAAERHTPQPQE